MRNFAGRPPQSKNESLIHKFKPGPVYYKADNFTVSGPLASERCSVFHFKMVRIGAFPNGYRIVSIERIPWIDVFEPPYTSLVELIEKADIGPGIDFPL